MVVAEGVALEHAAAEAVAVADMIVAALVGGFVDIELVVGEVEEVEVGFAAVAEGTGPVALAGAELAGQDVLSAELDGFDVEFVDDKQVEPVAQDDTTEVSAAGHFVVAAVDCEEDTQLGDVVAEEQVYAVAQCSGLVLQVVFQQAS
jgi:hypothetical protein